MYTDKYLLELLNTNREKAAELFVKEFSVLLSGICARNLSNPEDISECVNDTFAEFFLNPGKYNPSKGSIKNYLCKIAEHKSIDLFRKNCHRIELEKELSLKSKEDIYEQKYQTKENEQLSEALDQLPPLDQQILKMHYYEEKSYKEISEELGMSYEKVRKRGLRGKKKLLMLLLLALLVFGITACTTIVLKKEGLLPVWFPFYEWIPGEVPEEETEDTSVIITIPENHQFTPNAKTDDTNMEEVPVIHPDTEPATKKYYFSKDRGILNTNTPAYRLKENTQQFEYNGIRYELLDSFYYGGQLDIYLLATLVDTERWSIPPPPDYYSIEETREYLDKYHNLWDDQILLWDEEEANNYSGHSYIVTPQGTKIHNFSHASDYYNYNFNMRLYELSFS